VLEIDREQNIVSILIPNKHLQMTNDVDLQAKEFAETQSGLKLKLVQKDPSKTNTVFIFDIID
jgi:hypothetical protein